MKKILSATIILLSWGSLVAQTPMITDGLMVPKGVLGNGAFYGNDSWKNYWEGTLKRDNQNIGTVSTQSVAWMGVYGLKEKITLIGTLPYIWTNASGGTLSGRKGFQDLTMAVKYNFLKQEFGPNSIKLFALAGFSLPVTNYSPDNLPLSIGLGSKNISWRFTSTYTYKQVWQLTASGAYTWRSNVYLDRPSYWFNNQQYSTNEVRMNNLFDFIVRAGYHQPKWHAELFYTQQNTLGSGDMRRQETPFVADQMNFSKVGASFLWHVPQMKNLAARLWGSYTMAGRNVGQSTSVTAGLMYTLPISKTQE